MEENCWNWVECLFKRVPLPYYIVSTILGLIIYFGYVFFGIKIHQFPFPFYANLSAVSMCIMVAYELAGIQYLLNVMKRIFYYWSSLFEESADNICMITRKRFIGSYLYYILVLLVIAPFYLIDWIYPSEQNLLKNFMNHYLPIYSMIPTKWGVIFDIYLQFLGILALFFLATILWIMVNITWTLRSPTISPLNYPPKMNVFSTKMRVTSIRDLILKTLTYYFICISLAIISYLNPMIFFAKRLFFC